MSRGSVLHAMSFALALAILACVWLVVMTVTGWYHDPDRMEIAIVVPIAEVVLLVLACRQLRRDGCSSMQRLALCIAIVLVAALLSAGFAYVYTANRDGYFMRLQQAHAEGLQRAGKTDAEIVAALANHPIDTPGGFARNRFRNMIVFGIIGTLAGLAIFRGRTSGS